MDSERGIMMNAIVELRGDGNIIRFVNDLGEQVDMAAVNEIRVIMPAGMIEPAKRIRSLMICKKDKEGKKWQKNR